ncbi:hypothetical protein MASR1M31_08700 [Porphyromonadaceae bacterium]
MNINRAIIINIEYQTIALYISTTNPIRVKKLGAITTNSTFAAPYGCECKK